MEIVIIPDTNILLEHQALLSKFINDTHPFNIEVLILKIIVDEIDRLKPINYKAQEANKFIQNNLSKSILSIEGQIKKNSMEILTEIGDMQKLRTVDDKIVYTTSCINNAVLLSADRNIFLKCKSQNVKCVFVENDDYMSIKLEVFMCQTSIEPMEVVVEKVDSNKMRIVLGIIKPCVEMILIKNIGPGYKVMFEKNVQDADLCQLVDICIKNFSLFDGYLHRSSKNVLNDIYKVLKEETDENKKNQSLRNLLTIFKIDYQL